MAGWEIQNKESEVIKIGIFLKVTIIRWLNWTIPYTVNENVDLSETNY